MSEEAMLLKAEQVAIALGVSRAKAYALIAAGTIPSIRLGGNVRVPVRALQEWIDRQLAGRPVRDEELLHR